MANAKLVPDDSPPLLTDHIDSGLPVPPLDTAFFSQQFIDNDCAIIGDIHYDVVMDDLFLDFSFDDLCIPSAEELDDLLNPALLPEFGSQTGCDGDFPQFDAAFKSASSELRHASADRESSGDHSSGVLNSVSSESESHQVSGYLDVPSPQSNGSNHGASGNCGGDVNLSDCPSPESRGSGNCGSNVSDELNGCDSRLVCCPISSNTSTRVDGVDQKITLEEPPKSSLLKRKKDCEDLPNNKKSNCNSENSSDNASSGGSKEEKKRNARLVRNRESAHLSRQRKKLYVDELEEKVKIMQSTIQELNARVSHFMAENVTLRQQMGGGGAVPPPPMAPPYPAMIYPWMPYPPPYMVQPQGFQVPIPRLKTKKVAGISFLGLLFFIMLYGGLAPMVNMKYGGVGDGFSEKHHGRVLMVNANNGGNPNVVASLYVPRNDKLVKIDGDLIIHSVLGSESETGLAVPSYPAPGVRINDASLPQLPALGSNSVNMDSRQASDGSIHQWFREGLSGPMLSSGMCEEVFRFDASPSSASGAIFPATTTTARNVSENKNQNSTHLSKGKNRRILRGLPFPLPESLHNISRQHEGRPSQKENSKGNNSASPMVVSVLVDPRETGDADVDGVMGKKSLSKIFVVVLIDSAKYVTYSCMLPFKGSLHLVAT